jgi:hypothetical protein
MKKSHSFIWILLMTTLLCLPLFSDIRNFEGRWINQDPRTREITFIDIQVMPRGEVTIQAWYQGEPEDIDLGRVNAEVYSNQPQLDLFQTANRMIASFQPWRNQEMLLIITPISREQLRVDIMTRVTNPNRGNNYWNSYIFNSYRQPGMRPPKHRR